MNKENNCTCVVCQVEQSLLDALSTQTARTHFQVLARNYPILSHFDSPADVIAQLHAHEDVEIANHIAWNAILHALVASIADGIAEEVSRIALGDKLSGRRGEILQAHGPVLPAVTARAALREERPGFPVVALLMGDISQAVERGGNAPLIPQLPTDRQTLLVLRGGGGIVILAKRQDARPS